jgi:hypothetical protein
MHSVNDGEHISVWIYLFTLNNVFHRFSLQFLNYHLFKLQSPVWGGRYPPFGKKLFPAFSREGFPNQIGESGVTILTKTNSRVLLIGVLALCFRTLVILLGNRRGNISAPCLGEGGEFFCVKCSGQSSCHFRQF